MPLVDFTLAADEQGGTITVGPAGATVITVDGGDRQPAEPGWSARRSVPRSCGSAATFDIMWCS